jgi:hypothetical protein
MIGRTKQTWVHVTFTIRGNVRVRFEHQLSSPGNIKRMVGKEYRFLPEKRHKLVNLIKVLQKSPDRQYTVYAIDGYSVLIERRLK